MAKKEKKSPSNGIHPAGAVRIIPLGGLGEIGKNMMIIEYETYETHASIIIDTGIMFPENDMLGIDYIIPDFGYIMDRLDTIQGVIITHGHEDHTGAIAHVMEHVDAPVYASPLTRGLLEVKLKEAQLLDQVTIMTVQAGDTIQMGPFMVEFFHVCHSIPDSLGLGITTPVGLLVHTGDYKFDHTPVDGKTPDFAKLAEFSQRGVLGLLADSTNADVPGWTPSESVIDGGFDQVFQDAQGRIIVATFASLISRIQQVANTARRYGRKMAITGFSMVKNTKMARNLGYLQIPEDMLVDLKQAAMLPPDQVVIMTTGSQGEPSAGLGRLATGRHRQLQIEEGDTVIFSAHPIPGNEELVHRTMNKLIQRGAEVIHDPIAPVHVSGHAAQEEMKLLINLVRPRFFIPVHGELRHLHLHARLAEGLGIPPENIGVGENGTVFTLTQDSMAVGERVPGGYVFVDGSGVGDVGPAVIRERELLARDGIVMVNLVVNSRSGQILSEPEIASHGFVYLREAGELIAGAEEIVIGCVAEGCKNGKSDLRRSIERKLDKFFYNETKRRPIIHAFINEVD